MNNGDEVEILKGQFKGVIGKIINDDMFICLYVLVVDRNLYQRK